MKIAVPTMDGLSLSPHFGRSRSFLVMDVVDGLIQSRQLRENGAGHAGPCDHSAPDHGHDHGRFAALLSDCDVVLVGGIGAPARQALEGAGLKVFPVAHPCLAEDVALRYAKGTLPEAGGSSCGCSH